MAKWSAHGIVIVSRSTPLTKDTDPPMLMLQSGRATLHLSTDVFDQAHFRPWKRNFEHSLVSIRRHLTKNASAEIINFANRACLWVSLTHSFLWFPAKVR
jgi:hypothetical protein